MFSAPPRGRKRVVPEGSEQVAACHEGLRPDRPRRGAALSQARGEHKQGRHERVVRHPSRRLRVDAVAHGSARRRAAVAPTPLDDASRGSSGGATAAQRARARISSIWLSGSAQIAPEQAKGQPSWSHKDRTRPRLPRQAKMHKKAPTLKSAKGPKGSPKRRTSRGCVRRATRSTRSSTPRRRASNPSGGRSTKPKIKRAPRRAE